MVKRNISGVLLLDKPYGLSSNQALQKIKRIFNAVKAGHTGTLDPIATGLLPICFGEATKYTSYLLDGDKEYIATVQLGAATTTYDDQGDITQQATICHTINDLISCLATFVGEIYQVPPIYSAIKVDGRRLYSYARNNEEVVIKSRLITIHELELLEVLDNDRIKIRVLCSKGTYIRALIHDLGIKLGCFAHMSGLVRTKTNNFDINDCRTMESLIVYNRDELSELLLPMECMVTELNQLNINSEQLKLIKNGHSFMVDYQDNHEVRVYHQDKFLGVGQVIDQLFTPIRLINTSQL